MEGELWTEIYRLAKRIGKRKGVIRGTYTDAMIVSVYFWAVVHDRPNRWACDRTNWHGRGFRGPLPSPSTLSRRLRTIGVQQVIKTIERLLACSTH